MYRDWTRARVPSSLTHTTVATPLGSSATSGADASCPAIPVNESDSTPANEPAPAGRTRAWAMSTVPSLRTHVAAVAPASLTATRGVSAFAPPGVSGEAGANC